MSDTPSSVLSRLQFDKPFLKRPEGMAGFIGLIFGGLAVTGLAAFFLFPIITAMIWNTLNLIAASAILAFVCITIKPFSQFVWRMNQRLWRKLHEWSITIDPITALHEFLAYFERKLAVVARSVKAVNAVRASIADAMQQEQKEAEAILERARALEGEASMEQEMETLQRQADRITNRLADMQEQLNLVTRFVQFLKEYQRALKSKHIDVKDQISDKERRYKLAVATADAVGAMREVFGSGSEEQKDFELALSSVDDRFADTVAEMEMLESEASDLMTAIRIDDLTVRKNGSAKLDELERRLQSGVFTRYRVDTSHTTAGASDVSHQAAVEEENEADQLSGNIFADLYAPKHTSRK